jgi:hypothetical protein
MPYLNFWIVFFFYQARCSSLKPLWPVRYPAIQTTIRCVCSPRSAAVPSHYARGVAEEMALRDCDALLDSRIPPSPKLLYRDIDRYRYIQMAIVLGQRTARRLSHDSIHNPQFPLNSVRKKKKKDLQGS